MSKLIPQSFIDDLLARVDIVDIIGLRVKLRRTGINLVGLCPFHTEKTPSFTVSPNKQFFHCFGCSTHGNAIGFIMQFEHLSFVAAIENLAATVGLTMPKIAGQHDKTPYEELYKLTEEAASFFEQKLSHTQRAIDYLKLRGLTGKICKKFRIGYAPDAWESLHPIYKSSSSIKQQMITAGLLIAKDNKTYSRFRNRIMFPIRNPRGHIIGFGGRTIANDLAKYLNSPETPIFHKGEELYGLYEAKKAENNLKFIIVVEGYLDVVALAQFGITNVVATLGTAISTKQIQILLRNTQEVVFCFDGDAAGRGAAWRALENSLPLMRDGIQIKFLFLPEGHDPDSLVREKSKEELLRLLKTTIPLSEFFIKQLTTNINIETMDGKAKLAKIGQELLKKMPHGIFYQLLSNKIATLAGINTEELNRHENQTITDNMPLVSTTEAKTSINLHLPIQNTINILLHHPQFVSYIEDIDSIKSIKLDGCEILQKLICLLQQQPNITLGAILEHWRNSPDFDILNKLACKGPIIPKETLKNELAGIIQLLRQLEREEQIHRLLAKAATEELQVTERKILQHLIEISKK